MNPPRLFVGVGSGRCGTMAIANALAAEPGVICTHEGKLRHGETPGAQLLRFMTLDNRLAYETPAAADEIFARVRGEFTRVAAESGAAWFGDIAYNYAPFLDALTRQLPQARLFVLVRNGVDFVRSAAQAVGEDPTPVGWAPRGKPLSPVERYVELGRLAPRAQDPLAARWESLDHVARNAWLWAETNRLIFDAVAHRAAGMTLVLRFEDFFRDPAAAYPALRSFVGLPEPAPAAALATFRRPINSREARLGPYAEWTPSQRAAFDEFAGPMMLRLAYRPD